MDNTAHVVLEHCRPRSLQPGFLTVSTLMYVYSVCVEYWFWTRLFCKAPGQKANEQKATHHCHASFPHHCCIFCDRQDFCYLVLVKFLRPLLCS